MVSASRRLSPAKAAGMLGVSYATVLKLIEAKDIPAINVAKSDSTRRQWRVKREDVEAFERRRMNATAGGAA